MKTIVLAISMLAGAAGCSTTLAKHKTRHAVSAASEIRGGAAVRWTQARALLSGPAVVKHLETAGEGTLTLYLTDDPGIRDRACPGVGAEQSTPVAILKSASRITELTVPSGKRVCAAVGVDAPKMNVTWHAQKVDDSERALAVALAQYGRSQ